MVGAPNQENHEMHQKLHCTSTPWKFVLLRSGDGGGEGGDLERIKGVGYLHVYLKRTCA